MSLLSFHLLCFAFGTVDPVSSWQADAMVESVQPLTMQDARRQPLALALNPREVKPPPPLYDSEERQRRDNRTYRRNRGPRDRDYDYDANQDRSRRSRQERSRSTRHHDERHSNRHREHDQAHRSSRHHSRGRQEHRSAIYHDDRYDDRAHERSRERRDSSHRGSARTHQRTRSGGQYEQARYQSSQKTQSSSSSASKQRVRKTHEAANQNGPQHLLELGFGPFGHWWGAELSYLYHLRGGSVGPAIGAIVSGSSAPGVKSFSVGGKFQWDFDLFPNQSLKFYAGPFIGHSFQWESSMRSDIGATLRMVVQERWTLFVQPVALSVFTYLGKGPVEDRVWPTYHGAAGIGVVF